MSKRLWLVLGVIIVAALAGWGINRREKTDQQTELNSGKKIVVVINCGPKETDKVAVKNLKADIAEFNKIYPNIEIKWTDRGYSPDSFATSIAGGTAEDVITLWATEGYVAERGYAWDLTKMINDWEYKDQLNMSMLEPFKRNGRYYALPMSGYIIGMWYNKKIFRDAGLTKGDGSYLVPENWEEFARTAQKLTNRKKGIAGYGIYGKGAYAGWGMLNWVWQAGGDFEKEVGGKWRATFGESETVKAFEFVRDLRWKYDCLQPNLLLATQDVWPLFAAGQIAMTNGTNDWTPILINQNGMKIDEIGMALLPAGPAGRANQLGGDYCIINPNRPQEVQKAAFKWITWKLLKSVSPEFVKRTGEQMRRQGQVDKISSIPVFTGELDQKMRQTAQEYRDVLIDFPGVWQEASKYIKPEPPFFAQQLYGEYLSPVVQSVLTKEKTNPKQLLQKAAKSFEERFLNQGNSRVEE
jgi:ABC-type glycerol-3-phosphate transport system substrate-binding protein